MERAAKMETYFTNGFKMRREKLTVRIKNSLYLASETTPFQISISVQRPITNSLENMKWKSFTLTI